MNMRTFHKLSQHILNQNDENSSKKQYQKQNKENQLNCFDNRTNIIDVDGINKKHVSVQDVINLKKMNAKKIQQITQSKDKMLQEFQQNFEKEKKSLIQKYQKIVEEKDQYIKVLQQLYSKQPTQVKNNQNNFQPIPSYQSYSLKQPETSKQTTCRTKDQNNFKSQPYSQTLYLHQIPLYNELCYSIQRPIQKRTNQISEFCSTQKIKNRLINNSTEKNTKIQSSLSSSKYRSQSSNRGTGSKHGLLPAAPPKYCKIL